MVAPIRPGTPTPNTAATLADAASTATATPGAQPAVPGAGVKTSSKLAAAAAQFEQGLTTPAGLSQATLEILGEALTPEVSAKLAEFAEKFAGVKAPLAARADIDVSFDPKAADLTVIGPEVENAMLSYLEGAFAQTDSSSAQYDATTLLRGLTTVGSTLQAEVANKLGFASDMQLEPVKNWLFDGVDLAGASAKAKEGHHKHGPEHAKGDGKGDGVHHKHGAGHAKGHGKKVFEEAVGGMAQPVDINLLVQWVIRQCYLDSNEDLAYYADKVQFYNEIKKQIRDELYLINDELVNYAGMDETTPLDPPIEEKIFDGTYPGEGNWDGSTAPEPTVSDEERAEVARQQELEAQVPAAIEQYEADLAAQTIEQTVNVPPPPAPQTQDTKETAGTTYGNDLSAWYRSLSDEEKAAVRAELEANGISFTGYASEYDDMSEGESESTTQTLDPLAPGATDEEVEAYLESAAQEFATLLPDKADESAAQAWGMSAVLGGEMTATVPDPNANVPMPDVLVEAGYDPATGECANIDGYEAPEGMLTDKAGLENYAAELEEQIATVGDDAQLANVDLQNMLQKQQQAMQMLSNVSKMLHDTALNTIRKIGG